jgi:DNA-directed RNA polymerase subunit N (RpoN/RPB10)
MLTSGRNPEEVFDGLKIERYCCRRMFVGHAELNEEILPYIRE